MLKIALSVLSAAALVATMGVGVADAKAKAKMAKKKEMTAASCTASGAMRDESRFTSCFPMQPQAAAPAKKKK
jgi:hypothetical protein